MTEDQWLAETRVYLLVDCLRDQFGMARTKAGRRRLRLFSCACVRRVLHLHPHQAFREMVDLVERDADNAVAKLEYQTARQTVGMTIDEARTDSIVQYLRLAVWYCSWQRDLAKFAVDSAGVARCALGLSVGNRLLVDAATASSEEREQVVILREIVGNPFRPLKKRKFPADVRSLAQSCYEGDANLYPILADALHDLGEDAAAEHCRSATHVRGCHVVDWVLGRVV